MFLAEREARSPRDQELGRRDGAHRRMGNAEAPRGRPLARGGTTLRSQYGASALTGFVQLRIYM